MSVEQATTGTKILVPSDGSVVSARALPYALALSRGDDAEIILLMVIEPEEPIRDVLGRVTESSEELTRRAAEQAKQELIALSRSINDTSPVRCTHLIRVGEPAKQIGQVAEEVDVDVVIMASHGRGAAGRWTFGSVADEVSRASGPPVMIVRVPGEDDAELASSEPATIGRLIVPVDGSDLSKRALPVATDLALRLNVPLRLLMAVDFPRSGPTMGMDASWGFEAGELLEEMEQDASRILSDTQDALLQEHSDLDISMAVLRGPAASAISRAIEPHDVIVMSSHGRSGIRRLLLGSVAEQLVRTGPCPVLLVRATQA